MNAKAWKAREAALNDPGRHERYGASIVARQLVDIAEDKGFDAASFIPLAQFFAHGTVYVNRAITLKLFVILLYPTEIVEIIHHQTVTAFQSIRAAIGKRIDTKDRCPVAEMETRDRIVRFTLPLNFRQIRQTQLFNE
mgnify:CR=1 FL=1